jgi:hypothetical protein
MRLGRAMLAMSLFVGLCAACAGDADEPSTSPAPTAPTSTSPAVPPYLESYTAEERAAYDDAVSAYDTYIRRNNRFLAKGKATTDASDSPHIPIERRITCASSH